MKGFADLERRLTCLSHRGDYWRVRSSNGARVQVLHAQPSSEERIRPDHSGWAALDRLGLGVIEIQADLKVLFANALASALFLAETGVSCSNGHLHLPGGAEQALRSAMRSSGPGTWVRIDGDGSKPIIGRLLQATSRECEATEPGSYFLLLDLPYRIPAIQLVPGLRTIYKLTEAEARIASLVGRGLSPHQAALDLGVSEGTVRTQLKLVYLKLGISRQSDLVLAVMGIERLEPGFEANALQRAGHPHA